jgi:tripartite ATP-independent transporter DctP family solute receptor
MRGVRAVCMAAAAALVLSGCGTLVSKDEDFEGSITFSLAVGPDSHHAAGAYAFAEKLAELTDDRIGVDYYYNNALGGEREVVEGMSINSIQMGMASTGPMGGFVRSFMLFDMPYVFRDLDHVYTVLDGEIGDELAAEFEDVANVKIIGWTENGFRYETNSVRPIHTPEDLQGLKHRTQESAAQIDTWRAFGADAIPMAWPEVYTGLQQGVIDSQENPIATIADVNFQEVQDYIAMTQHVYSPAPMMISARYFETFSEADQQAIVEAGEYATGVQREVSAEMEDEALQELVDAGMEKTEIDREAFEEAAQPVIDAWRAEIPRDLIDRVIETEAAPSAAREEGGTP